MFPQSIPRLLNSGRAANGIPAPIIDLKKSLDARTEAAYWGYAWGRYVRKGMNLFVSSFDNYEEREGETYIHVIPIPKNELAITGDIQWVLFEVQANQNRHTYESAFVECVGEAESVKRQSKRDILGTRTLQ